MLKGPKHCLNLHGSCFVIFSEHSKKTSVRKSSAFPESTSNFQHFKEKMSLIADVLQKLETEKCVVT